MKKQAKQLFAQLTILLTLLTFHFHAQSRPCPSGNVLYVDANVAPSSMEDGTSWSNTYPDLQVMLDIYNSTDGPNWTNNTGWADGAAGTNCDPCTWFGVTCTTGRVTNISLNNNNLNGTLPALPTELKTLNLNNNSLNGSIPALPNSLTSFSAGQNDFTGNIPALPNSLTFFGVDQNGLTGAIPTLPSSLKTLALGGNDLSGTIPELPNGVSFLSFNNNNFTGNIPEIPASVTVFDVENNDLSGCFPTSLSELCDNFVVLSGNPGLPDGGSAAVVAHFCATGEGVLDGDNDTYCAGSFSGLDCNDADPDINPSAVEITCNGIDDNCDGQVDEGQHPDLQVMLDIYNSTDGPNWTNNTGWTDGAAGVDCHPCNWFGVSCAGGRVTFLNMPANQLNGPLPSSIDGLTQLETLWLQSNQLSGAIPPELGNLANLKNVRLYSNQLSGAIPPEVCLGGFVDVQ